MRQRLFISVWVLCFICALAGNTFADPISNAYGTNITIFDTLGTLGEDGEVEPGDINTQQWDLEGFFLKGNTLSLIGGFDFKNGVLDPYSRSGVGQQIYKSGDIFIGTDISKVKYGADIAGSYPTGYQTISNSFGYDYVIRLNFDGTNSYDVYAINEDSIVKTGYFTENSKSNPWIYFSGGTFLTRDSFFYQTGLTDAQTNLTGGSHNLLSVDLGFLPANTDFIAHFTMQCGNDLLIGQGATVPEPSTLLLLGSGLAVIGIVGRKLRS